jgi:hypothetical protein
VDIKFTSSRGIVWDDSAYSHDQVSLSNNYDFGSVEARPRSVVTYGADGENYYGSTVGPREDVFFEYNLMGSTRSDIDDLIETFKTSFNPSDGIGTLLVTLANGNMRALPCTVVREPVCLTGWDNRLGELQRIQVTLKAWNPYWLDPDLKSYSLASFTGGMTLPIICPMDFGTTNPSITIINGGNVPSPCVVTFTGAITNPRVDIYNDLYPDGVYMKAIMDLGAGEYLYVNTAQGNHAVRHIAGTTDTNAYGYWDPLGEFFMIAPGSNTITLTQSTAIGSTAACDVEFWERHIGV